MVNQSDIKTRSTVISVFTAGIKIGFPREKMNIFSILRNIEKSIKNTLMLWIGQGQLELSGKWETNGSEKMQEALKDTTILDVSASWLMADLYVNVFADAGKRRNICLN